MGLFKKKAPQESVKYLTQGAKLYFVYNMKLPEKILIFICGFIVGAIVGYVFYKLIPVAAVFGLIVGIAAVPVVRKKKIEKQIDTLKKQFQSLLESLATSIGSGSAVPDAFASALKDLSELFSKDAYIVEETKIILNGLRDNINIEDLLNDLAARSGIEDIQTFAGVFETCYRKGGDIKEVISSTYNIINDKIEVEMEIKTMVASSKAELTIMCFMPVVFTFLLQNMGDGITGAGTPASYLSTTIAIGIFVGAYLIGQRILKINL